MQERKIGGYYMVFGSGKRNWDYKRDITDGFYMDRAAKYNAGAVNEIK